MEEGCQIFMKSPSELSIGHVEIVFYIEKNGIGADKKDIEKLYRVLNHKG